MLAVVFWNSRNKRSTDQQYECVLSEFHKELNQNKPKGFRRSVSHRVCNELPWLGSSFTIFEDWYIMSNFAALDNLDRLVLEGIKLPSHRALMAQTGCASGAVMYLESGTPYVERSRVANWFNKPGGSSTESIAGIAGKLNPPRAISIWSRSMALGPRGNCLLTAESVGLPSAYEPVEIVREAFWAP